MCDFIPVRNRVVAVAAAAAASACAATLSVALSVRLAPATRLPEVLALAAAGSCALGVGATFIGVEALVAYGDCAVAHGELGCVEPCRSLHHLLSGFMTLWLVGGSLCTAGGLGAPRELWNGLLILFSCSTAGGLVALWAFARRVAACEGDGLPPPFAAP